MPLKFGSEYYGLVDYWGYHAKHGDMIPDRTKFDFQEKRRWTYLFGPLTAPLVIRKSSNTLHCFICNSATRQSNAVVLTCKSVTSEDITVVLACNSIIGESIAVAWSVTVVQVKTLLLFSLATAVQMKALPLF